jgi:hypothetical protein
MRRRRLRQRRSSEVQGRPVCIAGAGRSSAIGWSNKVHSRTDILHFAAAAAHHKIAAALFAPAKCGQVCDPVGPCGGATVNGGRYYCVNVYGHAVEIQGMIHGWHSASQSGFDSALQPPTLF